MAKRSGRQRSKNPGVVAAPSAAAEREGATRQRERGEDGECCALCHREVDRFTVHHLVPRARGGNHGPKARLCPTCHRQVHALFSETTLAEELYSIELLWANPRVAAFLRWMRKQRGTTFAVRRSRQRG